MKAIQRINMIIKSKGLSVRSFEKSIGVSNNSIGTAIKRNSNVTDETLNKILHKFPEINPKWLLTGEGNMVDDDDVQNIKDIISESKPVYNNIELVNCQKKIIELQNEIRDLEKLIFELKLEKNNIFTKLKKKI